jgi:hypothetical protein
MEENSIKNQAIEDSNDPNFFRRVFDLGEELFQLNLYAHQKKEVDYSFLCLSVIDYWLEYLREYKELTKEQTYAGIFVLRGRRLLRSIQLVCIYGYLPEIEILGRSLFELQLITAYVFECSSNDRIDKYIESINKNAWDFKLLCEDLLGEGSYQYYKHLSKYTHNSSASTGSFVYQEHFQLSAIHDYRKAGYQLVLQSNVAVSLCELTQKVFPSNEEWKLRHEKIYETEIFIENYKNYQALILNNNETLKHVLQGLQKRDSR